MTDTASLFRQITETKERGLAWAFRALISILVGALTIIGYFAVDKLGSFDKRFDQVDQQRQQVWGQLGKISETISTQNNLLTRLSDHLDSANTTLSGIQHELDDHETRIRMLERQPGTVH